MPEVGQGQVPTASDTGVLYNLPVGKTCCMELSAFMTQVSKPGVPALQFLKTSTPETNKRHEATTGCPTSATAGPRTVRALCVTANTQPSGTSRHVVS